VIFLENNNNNSTIHNRKNDHLNLSLDKDVESKTTTMLECVNLIHNSLPEMDISDVDMSCEFLGKKINAPIIIGALTGGTSQGKKINELLASAAQIHNLPMMVGSQRIALENPNTIRSFSIVRENAPDVPLIANIGIPQLVKFHNFESVEKIIKMIDADALAVHLNPLQEVIQPEGQPFFGQALKTLSKIIDYLEIPVIIKETGSGISKEVAKALINIGVKYIDVSGAGGISWAGIEYYRSKQNGSKNTNLGEIFWDWGIPTAASICEVKSISTTNSNLFIIGSGGLRTGLDIAKSISIGADFVSLAGPFLRRCEDGTKSLDLFINRLFQELKTAMFLTGTKNIEDLKHCPKVITSPLKNWLESRKIEI
jgi:isopentenyl-diphosphate delta-isomerase